MLGGGVFLLHLGNLVQQVLVLRFQFLLQALDLLGLFQQLGNDAVCLFPLGIQFRLGSVQLFLGAFQIGLFRLQLLPGLLNSLGRLVQCLQAAIVRCCDLLDHAHSVQQVGEAVGFEEDLPIAQGSLFLHSTDSGLIFLVQRIILFLGRIQLILLVRDQYAISSDLLVDIVHLGMEQGHFLIDQVLLCNDVGNLVLVLLILTFQFLHLGLHFRPLLLQAGNLLADFAGGSGIGPGGQQAENQRQNQHGRHNAGQNGNKLLAIFHRDSFGYYPM